MRIGDKPGGPKYQSDNFWQMADTGPCGPCSEIFYDHGPGVAGGPPGSPDADGDRYIEIWNLVFMQFNRDESGTLHPLPKPSVDTGMGLERIAAVLQAKHSNYEIDLFQDLIKAAARETHQKDLKNPSLNVIADHIRACSFLVVDGVIPGNEGRGYVLRRIIRRAIRHGYQLGQKQPFFHRIVDDLDKAMGDAYPELRQAKARVAETLKAEEDKFAETLENGMKLFELGAKTEARVMGYIRDHFVRDFTSAEEAKSGGVFHKANEDVLVAGEERGFGAERRRPGEEAGRRSGAVLRQVGQAGAHVPRAARHDRQDTRAAARQGQPRARLRQRARPLSEGCVDSVRRPHRVHALRHLRLSVRPDAGPVPRKGHPGRRVGLRHRDAGAAQQGARGVEVLHGGGPGVLRREDRVPRLRGADPGAKVVALYREGARCRRAEERRHRHRGAGPRRRSTPSRAARSATAASWSARAAPSRWPTRRRSAPTCTATMARSRPARSRSATGSRRASTPRCAPAPCATTR